MERSGKKAAIFIVLLAITVLVVLGSAIFTCREFRAFCYNDDDAQLSAQISDTASEFCEKKSIFFLKEKELAAVLEDEFPTIRVVNIERIFPSTVKVNYEVIRAEAYDIKEGVYRYFSADGKVLSSDGGTYASQTNLVKVTAAEEKASGEYAYDPQGFAISYLSQTVSVISRMRADDEQRFASAGALFSEMDVTAVGADVLTLTLRSGAKICVIRPQSSYEDKLVLAVSAISVCEESKRTSGVWTVDQNKIAYSAN